MGEWQVNTENITILEDDMLSAQTLCVSISDKNIRERAVANIVGAKIASRFFEENYSADSETGLHNMARILEKFDISDIYVNNSYIDVRVYFTEEELCVPKSHFDTGILPVVYMFIKLSSDLSGGTVTGFMKPENIPTENLMNDYFYIKENSLESFYDIESHLTTTLDVFEIPSEIIYKFLEGSLDKEAQIATLKELIKSKSSRAKLAKIIKAQDVLNSVIISETNTETLPEDNLDDLFLPENSGKTEEEELLEALDYTTEVTPSNSDLINGTDEVDEGDDEPDDNNSEFVQQDEDATPESELGTLFTGEQEGVPVKKKKASSGFIIIMLLLLLAAGGFYAYNNVPKNNDLAQGTPPEISEENINEQIDTPSQPEAMPVETVEAVPVENDKQEEAVGVAIPAIEKHLDASVLVSNLRVEWEIPTGYSSSVKHYLYKLGKIIQLNLRSDLLLLNKPPLSNRITVEFKYNPNIASFELVGIKDSSGEKTVDDTISETIKNVLRMHISSNTESFEKIHDNPVLIIRL